MNIVSVAKRLVHALSKLHLRGLVLLLGLLLVCSAWRPLLVQKLDAALFRLGALLMEAPKGATGILIVDIPQQEITTWQADINQAGNLGALLSNILHNANTVVGLVLDYPIDARTASADLLLDNIAKLPAGDNESLAKARELSQRKSFLLEFLRHPRVVVGVYDRRFPGLKPFDEDWGKLAVIPQPVRSWLWRNRAYEPVELPGSLVSHHPIYRSAEHERVLITSANEHEASAGFILHYLDAEQRLAGAAEPDYVWYRDSGLQIGSLNIATSPSGSVVPVYGVSKRMTPAIERIDLDEAMARSTFPARVYISAEGSELASKLAMTTYSLESGMTVHAPWWYLPLEKVLLILLTLYLVLLVPRLSGGMSVVLSAFIFFLLLVTQIIAQATQKLWLPVGLASVWLVLGHILILMWLQRREEWLRLVKRADEACIDQARSLVERSQLKSAREVLIPCETHNAVLVALYEIGNAHASKRQYKDAIEVFRSIEKRKKNFRDVREKIAALRSMLAAAEKPELLTPLDRTVVLDTPEIEKPVLGRYEICEELGRGAMGTVYLAYDPRISRNVAIKTLSYQQFQGQQLEELKARFFREAEAAGRLSHPNIVSVFDVGEEHDLAYIAMDFAEGKPLSSFVTQDNLLPMFEVYRIIGDVAQALEYAHNNQIVHRDVKPGNIMYNAAPYQLKVTDFGIARLVDNSKTSTGEILGSPLYMAPEQLKGKRVNHLADIFSLGVTFYQLLTGRLPFQGENLASLTYEIIHGKHKSPKTLRKDLPSSAARIINQALQKEPEDRYTSAAEMAMVIKKAIKRDFAHEAKRTGYL